MVLPQGMSIERYKFLREVAGEMRGGRAASRYGNQLSLQQYPLVLFLCGMHVSLFFVKFMLSMQPAWIMQHREVVSQNDGLTCSLLHKFHFME